MRESKNRLVMTLAVTAMVVSSMSFFTDLGQGKLQASIDRGKSIYTARCLSCHQVDGTGVPNMNPPLVKTQWVLGDKSALIQIVLNGMNSGVEIDGMKYHNVMASHADLNDLQIADALTYVRNSFGNKAKAVTEAEVKAERAKKK